MPATFDFTVHRKQTLSPIFAAVIDVRIASPRA
jgi:hypothetical protein